MRTRPPRRDFKGSASIETLLDFVFFHLWAKALTFSYITAHIGGQNVRVIFISYGNRIRFKKIKNHILNLRISSIYYMIFFIFENH